jgi:outer membrane protein OmpA-like peptidoglycan-associated protein/tetratricopeptide (TPR) repeat protein
MKHIFLIVSLFSLLSCATAQQSYSTKNKKAISLFEEGQKAPNQSASPNGMPNYPAGIALMDKAIEKDPMFWEAYLVAGEFAEYSNQYSKAIKYYEEALRINPNHSVTGSTQFYLANLKFAVADYKGALDLLKGFISNRNANPEYVKVARELQASCEFSIQALNNPSDFEPINIGPGINTKDPEYFPTITVDGKTILFTRRIFDARVPRHLDQPENLQQQQEDFYISHLSDKNIWMKADPMPVNINTVNNEGAPTLGPDGRTLIFVGCPDQTGENYGEGRNGKGSCDFFITKKLGQKWTNPINLPGGVNTRNWETQPSLSSDGKTMYFIRGMRGQSTTRNDDIYMSTMKEDGTWNEAVKLPSYINSPQNEESVLIHPDGKTLYFASRGHVGMGGTDLFVSRMDDKGNWGKPENLGYPINTKFDENSLMVSADGEIAFFASDRAGGYGDLDIYYFVMPEKLRPTKTLYFEGIVYDAVTKKPVPGRFQLIDVKTGKEVIRSQADLITGEFMVSLPLNADYALSVEFEGYFNFSKNFNMTVAEGLESFKMDVPMIPLTSAEPVLLDNIFFDFNKTALLPESYVELAKLKKFLVQNPTYKIELGGHTDTRGEAADNLVLSQGRAKAVVDYLIKEGIAADRLVAKGYGETLPKIADAEIAKLKTTKEQEAAHRKNRRTEYKIIAR